MTTIQTHQNLIDTLGESVVFICSLNVVNIQGNVTKVHDPVLRNKRVANRQRVGEAGIKYRLKDGYKEVNRYTQTDLNR